jgi:dimethylsulfone monooxygenase
MGWTFDYNAALTRRAKELGFDLVFGLAQWAGKGGYGGVCKYREDSLDPLIAVTALSTMTERILLISTIHVLFGPWHPLHLTKFGATIDHISGGRWGINVVTGYSPREAQMFGGQHIEHDCRYEMAEEFTDTLCRLWGASDDLTLQGKYWALEKAFVMPKPRFGRPVLVNATGSPAGIAYANNKHVGGHFLALGARQEFPLYEDPDAAVSPATTRNRWSSSFAIWLTRSISQAR